MAIGQTTGVRSLQELRFLQEFVASKARRLFLSEMAGSVDGKGLFDVVAELDKVAAGKQDSAWRQEHTDAYCLARDFRYGHRSRRWLHAKSIATDFDLAYHLWLSFVTENFVTQPQIKQLSGEDVNALAQKPFNKVLNV